MRGCTGRLSPAVVVAVFMWAASAPQPARADAVVGTGTPASCTEAALNAALGCDSSGNCAGDGNVTFNCGASPVTITVTSPKTMAGEASIDGGGLVTLSGGGTTQVFNVNSAATLNLADLPIINGSSAIVPGGAIVNAGTLTVTNSTFSGNSVRSSAGSGGGGAISNSGTLTVTNSTFSGNSAAGGGAIINGGTLTVTNSTFSGNSAPSDGGAIINNAGTLTVTNSTFSGNSAFFGGAIDNGGTLTVTNSTFSSNTSNSGIGGAIFGGSPVTLRNTIVASSTSGPNCSGTIIDGGHNLDSDGTCGVGPATDPMLDPAGLANNGGPTQTIALLPGSPAIDAGDETVCAAAPVNNLDQRGYVRPGVGAANCSIGAFEFNSSGPPLPSCVGDCAGNGQVTVSDVLTLVNLVLGNGGACPDGVASGVVPDVSVILQAVTNALNGCPAQ